ncbi:ABC transporter ATP-binding protein [Sporolactobacillus shoreicorticis]|uniref:ATP-binding cassette domain-containing protein n=1 Tax=Sporolactobacillus shoreicorticis TaxID=1923877 RepID=A0ABW5S1N8_9BACL|nr:ABC transporter ATP-binding protein [Sporolactobacillus shoreicorticis]MCO7127235.1 ABC transporter ATP-binding protein [Sporolactobacillus shoreicorticis]
MNVLEVRHIQKNFGRHQVLSDLNFAVSEHSIFGLIGKNGAGKTTAMKMILGFLRPAGGEIRVCGENVIYGNTATNRLIGYLPDVPEFYGYMTAREYLTMCGRITGLTKLQTHEWLQELLPLVGLDGIKRRIHSFSRGMKQRLGIAQALLNKPRLLICDEATSALDPKGRKEILDLLSVAADQTTVLFSTHILSDVERICDSIGLLHEGRLALHGKLSEIKNTYRKETVRIETLNEAQARHLLECLDARSFIQSAERSQSSVTVQLHDPQKNGLKIIDMLSNEQIPILNYELLEPSLENVFLDVIK